MSTLKRLKKLLITIIFEARYRFFPLKPVPIFTGALKLRSWNYSFSCKWDNSLCKPKLFCTVIIVIIIITNVSTNKYVPPFFLRFLSPSSASVFQVVCFLHAYCSPVPLSLSGRGATSDLTRLCWR